jgi:hypothetical protein
MSEWTPKSGKLVGGGFTPKSGKLVDQPKQSSIAGELTSPKNVLSTVGDIAGGDIGPLSALLSGAGYFAGSVGEDIYNKRPIDLKQAGKGALEASAISAVTPAVVGLGAKAIKPVVSGVGNLLESFGKTAVKTSTPIDETLIAKGLDKGFNAYDEYIKRGFGGLSRENAKKALNESLNIAENKIREAIKAVGDPVVAKASEIKKTYQALIQNAVEESDKKAIKNLLDGIDLPENITASKALDIKRKLYAKGVNAKTYVAKARNEIAKSINDAVKTIEPIRAGLREEEILLTLKPALRKLEAKNVKQGLSVNVFQPVQSLVKNIGAEGVGKFGQFSSNIGKTVKAKAEKINPNSERLNALLRYVRQSVGELSR